MAQSVNSSPAQTASEAASSDSISAALDRCRNAYRQAQAEYAQYYGCPIEAYVARRAGRAAFRDAMPSLTSRDSIRAFVACVTDAILIEAIREDTCAILLRTAKLAVDAIPRQPSPHRERRRPGRPRKSASPPVNGYHLQANGYWVPASAPRKVNRKYTPPTPSPRISRKLARNNSGKALRMSRIKKCNSEKAVTFRLHLRPQKGPNMPVRREIIGKLRRVHSARRFTSRATGFARVAKPAQQP